MIQGCGIGSEETLRMTSQSRVNAFPEVFRMAEGGSKSAEGEFKPWV